MAGQLKKRFFLRLPLNGKKYFFEKEGFSKEYNERITSGICSKSRHKSETYRKTDELIKITAFITETVNNIKRKSRIFLLLQDAGNRVGLASSP